MTIQKELYDLRKNENKMSRQVLADYLGISVQAYRDKKKGKRAFTQDEMFAIAELFYQKIKGIENKKTICLFFCL